MIKIQFNLGMNNNPFTSDSAASLIKATFPTIFNSTAVETRMDASVFEGNYEPTLVGRFYVDDASEVRRLFQLMSELFTQQCIAVKIDDDGYLEYDRRWTGDRYEFDEQYFINY